jgi:TATA-box binding protein (TBP) (component of TFIID and TFIIIB)
VGKEGTQSNKVMPYAQARVVIFETGKIVINGARKPEQMQAVFEAIHPILEEFQGS